MVMFHRKGTKFHDNGKGTLTWKPGEPFKVKQKKKLEFLKHTNPVAFRELAEQTLIELVNYLVQQNNNEPVELSLVQREGSYKIGVSPETIKRYVFTHSASEAELCVVGKRVKLNPNFTQDDDEEDDPTPSPSPSLRDREGK